jgi:hypothetical protein
MIRERGKMKYACAITLHPHKARLGEVIMDNHP